MSDLHFRGITKSFGAVRALQGVSFSVRPGEAHAVVGENGAGKSTLMKILAGIERADSGSIHWLGSPLALTSPRDALDRGIGMVYQEMMLFPNLTASGNIFAGRERTTRFGRLRTSEMRKFTQGLLEQLHLSISPDAEVASLSIAHQQLLQIARALAFDCRILILDEPTTCLTDAESSHLFAILQRLQKRGVTLLYVSHKLEEVFRLCDRITVLRDGGHVSTVETEKTRPAEIVQAMVGRELDSDARPAPLSEAGAATPLLEVRRLTRRPGFEDVSLSVRAGEIVGLFGLVGSGRSDFVETLFGLRRAQGGDILVRGKKLPAGSPVEAVRAGLALAPEERHKQGLFFNLTLRENLLLPVRNARGSWVIERRAEERTGEGLVRQWRIKTAGLDAMPDSLSGGNQQKVVLAKWLATEPKLLLLDEPTKGVDVGAKFEIHEFIRLQASRGMGCLVVSSELPEILALAHRIVVFREGRVQGELEARLADEESIMRLATAVARQE